ncbi:metallophosphoesterase family protein [Paenibacillus sp. KS-LC4]|uniref:purple acid phosphatase family protein n=1 Tax=Paenibacillus sp. KS-LC4 TaxID=2979727 RepID=UPI0030D3A47D
MKKEWIWIIAFCLILLLVVAGIERLKSEGSTGKAAGKPYAIVTTFKGDAATSRAFTWFTDNPQAGSVIEWVEGMDAGRLSGDSEGEGAQTASRLEGKAATLDVGSDIARGVHKVELTGLSPGTAYTYRVGDGSEGGWSEAFHFMTEAQAAEHVTFINVTDSQGITEQDFELWGNTLDQAFATFPSAQFIVHNGDLTENPDDEISWQNFFGKAQQWVARFPLMPVTGNHDEVDNNANEFVSHFNLPENGADGSIAGTTYSYDYGPAHFIMLNTESNKKAQTKWLEQDLAATAKQWIIVSVHRGPYAGNQYEKIDDWVKLFDKYGVDLVLQGHNHEYARSYPLKDGKVTGDGEGVISTSSGTVYVVTNAAGQKFNEKKEEQFYHKIHFQNYKQMFAGITIEGDKLSYEAYDVDGKKLDAFVLQSEK